MLLIFCTKVPFKQTYFIQILKWDENYVQIENEL